MKQQRQLWVREGDNANYEKKAGPYEAGYDVGILFDGKDAPEITWRSKGVTVDPHFTGYNYISLFWGDEDAQPVGKSDLSASERAEFKRGLYESADIQEPVKVKRTGKKAKPKSKKSVGAQLTLGGMR